MVVTVFRCRLRPGAEEEYAQWLGRMSALAGTMAGHVAHKGFVAPDGERVAIVEFDSEEAQNVWARNAEHIEAKKKGRAEFYLEYRVQVCSQQYERKFSKP